MRGRSTARVRRRRRPLAVSTSERPRADTPTRRPTDAGRTSTARERLGREHHCARTLFTDVAPATPSRRSSRAAQPAQLRAPSREHRADLLEVHLSEETTTVALLRGLGVGEPAELRRGARQGRLRGAHAERTGEQGARRASPSPRRGRVSAPRGDGELCSAGGVMGRRRSQTCTGVFGKEKGRGWGGGGGYPRPARRGPSRQTSDVVTARSPRGGSGPRCA
jgi:hypothetical protein